MEDAVVAAVASLLFHNLMLAVLLSRGFGADRFKHVSDFRRLLVARRVVEY
jgi:hypothetical protein